MGNVSSSEGAPIYVRDQARFSVTGVTVSNSRGQTLLKVAPNSYPAQGYRAQREAGEDSQVEYIQDPDSLTGSGAPSFLLRLSNSDEIIFNFTIVLRQQAQQNGTPTVDEASASIDSHISGLTYIFASSQKELDNLTVREFHSDPNLHKNPNVELVGDYSTSGSTSVQFNWTWRWRPPKPTEDRGGGWRNSCSFVEYNQRAHRLDTLATFSFWVQNTQRHLSAAPRSPRMETSLPPRLRVPSTQSIESRVSNVSDSEGEGSYKDYKEPQSPTFDSIPEDGFGLSQTMTGSTATGSTTVNSALASAAPGSAVKVDVASCKPGEDPSVNEDGPLFRATMKSLEQKTGNMRLRMKKVLRSAEAADTAQQNCNVAVADFTNALREASTSNMNAVKPALDHYFDKIAKEISHYERQNAINLRNMIIDPIARLYNIEIKQADYKKREFDEESKEYYAYVSKYLGQRSESLKEKKQKQSDEKYQAKRRTFELKRFDYSSFMHDLHGGRKDQEVLSQLTKYAEAQARSYLATAKKVEDMVPQLDALILEVKSADQNFQLQRSEREEKRRTLEKSSKLISEDGFVVPPGLSYSSSVSQPSRSGEVDLARSGSIITNAAISTSPPTNGGLAVQPPTNGALIASPGPTPGTSSSNAKFKGIRDLEDNSATASTVHRKEGLLWALSRPGSHVDPRGMNKAAWHKFWIVLDQGKLSEYVNWKDKLDLHIDPIDLRMASVREARTSERRFCFEVITPQFTRVYQAPSEEDMKSWIGSINNALQSAFETRSSIPNSPSPAPSGHRKDIAAVLTGKSSSFSGHRQISNPNRSEAPKAVGRHSTVGDRPSVHRDPSTGHEPEPSALLQRIRAADEGNKVCADCGSDSKVDWCSINLGVLLCIECSGIHRSLGTHISKVRSLTLDTNVFTPDLVEILLLVGNRVSNMVWEAKLDRFLKPSPHSTRDQRLHFIQSKYAEKMYVQPALGTQAPDDFLLTSIKRNDIQSVLHALALRANPNAHDRSRHTHAVFLALAAADPASPAGFSHGHSSSTTSTLRGVTSPSPISPSSRPGTPSRKPFAVAELLLQNGAEVPAEPSPFPLSDAAKQYLEFKNDQRLGRTANNPAMKDSTAAQPDASNLLAVGSPAAAGSGLSPDGTRGLKERERLLKRNSGGGFRASRPSWGGGGGGGGEAVGDGGVRK